jgi:RND family efflux transporter MFP subunit
LLITGLYLVSCSKKTEENESRKDTRVSVQVQAAIQHSTQEITLSGQVESQSRAIISTRVMGFISEIKVKPGDKVQKDQLLVVISSEDILARRAQAQAMISESEAAVGDAQRDYERFRILYQQESATAKEFENATLKLVSAKAKAEAAQQMKREADAILSYTKLVAPFTGLVTQKHIDAGSLSNPGMPILSIEQTNSNSVRAFVSENDIGKLQNGMHAEVTIKSTGRKIRGKVAEISPSSQFTGGQFQIKVVVDSAERLGLLSGMYVNVIIPLNKTFGAQTLFVPSSAIIHKDQLTGLYTVGEDRTAQLRWIKVGKQRGKEIEILSGLDPGEKFITQSEGKLYSGVPVSVK